MESLKIFGTTYNNVAGIKATDASDNVLSYTHPSGTVLITSNGTVDVSDYASANVSVSGYSFDEVISTNKISGRVVATEATVIYAYLCYGRTAITSLYSTSIISMRTSAMEGCTSLATVVLTNGTYLSNDCLKGCTSLTGVDIGGVTTTFEYSGLPFTTAFSGDSALNVLIIRNPSIVTKLNNINNFTNTKFASGKAGGTLYVPSALISSYKTASNWSTLFGDSRASGYSGNSIVAIEGSIYETQYVDGTPIS